MTIDIPGTPFPEMVFDLSKLVIEHHNGGISHSGMYYK